MALFRENPYSAFNFLVDLEPGQGTEVLAAFSEVSGLNAEVTVAEYRAGNHAVNYVQKVPGIHKAGDVTLKRGVIGAQDIYEEWLELCRSGKIASRIQAEHRGQAALRGPRRYRRHVEAARCHADQVDGANLDRERRWRRGDRGTRPLGGDAGTGVSACSSPIAASRSTPVRRRRRRRCSKSSCSDTVSVRRPGTRRPVAAHRWRSRRARRDRRTRLPSRRAPPARTACQPGGRRRAR